jgi:predicted transcriptional regulator of viral defense system
MAKGTYISENITHSQKAVMFMLDEYEIDIFSLSDLKQLVNDPLVDVNEIIENLVNQKVVSRIERSKYARANFRDERVIGCFLVPDGTIAYWSALNLHGLTEQFSNTIFIQTTHTKQDKTVFGVRYQFVKIKNEKCIGIETQGFGNQIYRITDKEKTIVDCFDLPHYSGGYAELIRAFGQTDINQDKLIEYCTAIGNVSVTKRLAFLTEILEKPKMKRFLKYAEQEVNARYSLMDPFGEEKGGFNTKWKLRLNITEEELLDICNKHY